MLKRYWLLITHPNEVVWDMETRWDMERECWYQLWFRLWTRPIGRLLCRFGKHDDFVNRKTKTARCIWCKRVTETMPRWYSDSGS